MKRQLKPSILMRLATAGLTAVLLVSCVTTPPQSPTSSLPSAAAVVITAPSQISTVTPAPVLVDTPTALSDTATPTVTTTPTATPTAIPDTPVAVITADSQVKRLSAGVFAGQANPLPEIKSNDAFTLNSGGLLTTDKKGQAEVILQNCLKLFVFQDTSLTRKTCRKEDAASGLGVCGTAGMTGVVNNCLSQVNIQTPSSNVATKGTWFSVIYLPDDQLSIVQVYEGAVDVRAVTDIRRAAMTDRKRIEAGNLWFSSPGQESPTINGVEGRQQQPMEVWQALRPALINKYPMLDVWMASARSRARTDQLAFPNFLAPATGRVTLHPVGLVWENKNLQDAFLRALPWREEMNNLWSEFNITPRVEFPDRTISDARSIQRDLEKARSLLDDSGFNQYSQNFVTISYDIDDYQSQLMANDLVNYLGELGIKSQQYGMTSADLKIAIDAAKSEGAAPLIWIQTSGDAFK